MRATGATRYSAFQKSRNANPPPDPSFNDPNRDWTLDNDETVNNVDLYLDLNRTLKNTDVSLNYTFSDSDNGFAFGGPRIPALAAAGQFLPLPNVTNSWHQFRADVKYFFTSKVGVGAGWWYEKFDVTDFATIDQIGQPGTPRVVYLGEVYTGYGNRPVRREHRDAATDLPVLGWSAAPPRLGPRIRIDWPRAGAAFSDHGSHGVHGSCHARWRGLGRAPAAGGRRAGDAGRLVTHTRLKPAGVCDQPAHIT